MRKFLIGFPTGDGICVALLNIDGLAEVETPYDVHVRIALDILKRSDEHNERTEDGQRKFQVRIGINENVDNVVKEINGKRNVAGDGINMAQRVMSLADGNQILCQNRVPLNPEVATSGANCSVASFAGS